MTRKDEIKTLGISDLERLGSMATETTLDPDDADDENFRALALDILDELETRKLKGVWY